MPQSRTQTNDKGSRSDYKERLKSKLDGAFAAEEPVSPVVIRLPDNHDTLTEPELLFTLINNSELQHSAESAKLAVSMLYGRAAKPAGTTFEVVRLEAPVPLPSYAEMTAVQRKPGTVAPGFSRTKDSSPARKAAEDLKKAQFKQALADKIESKLTEPVVTTVPKTVRPLVQTFDGPPAERRPNPVTAKKAPVRAADSASFDWSLSPWTSGPALPENYRELSESALGAVLQHNENFMHTPESVTVILDVLFGRRPVPVALSPEVPVNTSETGSEPTEDAFLLPANYRDFSASELHQILISTPELGHTEETAAQTMRILSGGERPTVVIKPSEFIASPVAKIPTAVKRNKSTGREFSAPPGFIPAEKPVKTERAPKVEPRTITVPANYLDFNNDPALHEALRSMGHDEETALLAMRTLRGWISPTEIALVPTEFVAEIPEAPINVVKRNKAAEREFTPPPGFVFTNTTKEMVERPVRNKEPQVLLFPSNYDEFKSDTELHEALLATEGLGHNEESALLAMQVYRGWASPLDAVIRPSDIEAKIPETVVKQPIRNRKEQVEATPPEWFVDTRAMNKPKGGRWVYVQEEE